MYIGEVLLLVYVVLRGECRFSVDKKVVALVYVFLKGKIVISQFVMDDHK